MKPIQDVSIIGAGAMGAFYASRFSNLDGVTVSLVADGDRCDRLRAEGIIVNGRRYAIPVIRPGDDEPPSDLVLVAVKSLHLDQALRDLEGRVGNHTILLSVMNGIDSEERLGAAFGMDKVLYAIALGIDSVRNKNHVNYTNPGVIQFGEVENSKITERVVRVQELFDRAGVHWETPLDMIRTLWWKFMINVGVNQVSAVLRVPYGVFQRSREAVELMEWAMREVIGVAEKEGVALTLEDIEKWKAVLRTLGPEGKTSMLQDVEAGRKTEIDIFAGKVIQLGETHRVPVPVNRVLFNMIRVAEER
ncbi:MAG: ketopantoate reductase family protein [Thermodesulfobacteriota bacterium]